MRPGLSRVTQAWLVMAPFLDRERGSEPVAGRAAQAHDAGVDVTRRVHAVGEQRPTDAAGEIEPQAGAGEAGVADRVAAAGVAARPAFMRDLPADGALAMDAGADRGEAGGAQRAAFEHVAREAEHAVDRAEQPGMPGGAAQR